VVLVIIEKSLCRFFTKAEPLLAPFSLSEYQCIDLVLSPLVICPLLETSLLVNILSLSWDCYPVVVKVELQLFLHDKAH